MCGGPLAKAHGSRCKKGHRSIGPVPALGGRLIFQPESPLCFSSSTIHLNWLRFCNVYQIQAGP